MITYTITEREVQFIELATDTFRQVVKGNIGFDDLEVRNALINLLHVFPKKLEENLTSRPWRGPEGVA